MYAHLSVSSHINWNVTRQQALRYQQAFLKPCLVKLISKDTHLVFSILISKDTHLVFSILISKDTHLVFSISDVLLLYNLDCLLQLPGDTSLIILCTTGFSNQLHYATGTHRRLKRLEGKLPLEWFIR